MTAPAPFVLMGELLDASRALDAAIAAAPDALAASLARVASGGEVGEEDFRAAFAWALRGRAYGRRPAPDRGPRGVRRRVRRRAAPGRARPQPPQPGKDRSMSATLMRSEFGRLRVLGLFSGRGELAAADGGREPIPAAPYAPALPAAAAAR